MLTQRGTGAGATDGTVLVPDGLPRVILSDQVLEHVEEPLGHGEGTGSFSSSQMDRASFHAWALDLPRRTGPGRRGLLSTAALETRETESLLGRVAHNALSEWFHPRIRPYLALGLHGPQFHRRTDRVRPKG